jgi:oligopeptide transport system substrate-binding protein
MMARMHPLRLAIWLLFVGLVSCSPYPYPGEEGTVMHIALGATPKSLDPPMTEDSYSNKIASQIYEGLLSYHPYARPYQLIPAIASEMPTISANKMTYTFNLREDVYFADDPCFADGKGRQVTAKDFVWAFKRFAHPETGAKGWWLFDGKIEGLNEWRDKLEEEISGMKAAGLEVDPLYGMDRTVRGVDAVGPHELRIRLAREGEGGQGNRSCMDGVDNDKNGLRDDDDPQCDAKPYPQLLWVLAMPYASVYPQEAVEYYGSEFRNNPVGTGPFKLKEYNPVYRVVMERNPIYREVRVPDPVNNEDDRLEGWDWQADVDAGLLEHAGERIPLVSGMEIRFIQEDQPRWLYFKSGYLDFLIPPKDNMKEAVVQGSISSEMEEKGVRLVTWPELGTVYTAFNLRDPVMQNVHLRRAIALAIDHSWVIDNLYAGQAIMAKSVIPPGVSGYDPDHHPYHSDDGSADIDRAMEELQKAGYPGGIDPSTGEPIKLIYQSSGTTSSDMQHVDRFVDDLRRIGVKLEVVNNTWPQMLEKMDKGEFQIAGLAWGFDYPDAQNILQMFYSANIDMGLNNAFYESEVFDQIYEQAAAMEDSPERTELYEQMAHMVGDEVPWVTRVHRIKQNLQQPWLGGFKYTEVNEHYWRYASIDKDMREQAVEEWNEPTRWPIGVLVALIAAVFGFGLRKRRQEEAA